MGSRKAEWSWENSVEPMRGDWCLTKPSGSRITCKEYDAPPPAGRLLGKLPKSYLFGPVHEVQNITWVDPKNVTHNFVCVRVPSYREPSELAWVNIENNGVRFAALDRKWAGFLDGPFPFFRKYR